MSSRILPICVVCIGLLHSVAVAEDPPIIFASQAARGSWYWVQLEYLRWHAKNAPLDEPLATTAPPGVSAILGSHGTETLFGDEGLDFDVFPGARLTGGFLLSPSSGLALEANGFALGQRSVLYSASDATGETVIARPIIDELTEMEAVALVSSRAEFAGGVDIVASSQLWGAEANLTLGTSGFPIRWIAGFRYLDLDEGLFIDQSATALADGAARFGLSPLRASDSWTVLDSFETENKFYGGQLGGATRFSWSIAWIDLIGKVALGSTHRRVRIDGSTSLADGSATLPGGLLGLPSNMGLASDNSFSAIPEVELRLGCRFASRVSAHIGYSFLYWPHVVRPGDQIDRTIDLRQSPGSVAFDPLAIAIRPIAPARDTDYFVHGLTIGVQLNL